MFLPDVIGLIGVVIILIAYFLLQISYFKIEDILFSLINVLGSLMILYSLWFNWNFPAVVIEVAWVFISLYGVFNTVRKKAKGTVS